MIAGKAASDGAETFVFQPQEVLVLALSGSAGSGAAAYWLQPNRYGEAECGRLADKLVAAAARRLSPSGIYTGRCLPRLC